MFWGLIMEPGMCYTQYVKVSFHISMAAIDIANSNDEPAQVMCVFEGRNYLLCTLDKNDKFQCPLDLKFKAGSKVSFATNGNSHIHLTGYLTGDEVDSDDDEQVPASKKRKTLAKFEGTPRQKTTAQKKEHLNLLVDDSLYNSSSDSDFIPETDDTIFTETNSDEDEEEAGDEENEDDDDEEEEEEASDDDEEESEDLDLEEEEDEEMLNESQIEQKTEIKQKVNGVSKKKNKKIASAAATEVTPSKTNKKAATTGTPKKSESKKPAKKTIKGGIIIQDIQEGSGERTAQTGHMLHVYYEGRLKENKKLFDSYAKGRGFGFIVGKNQINKGLDAGVIGMKVGGKRRIVCPPAMAYGAQGSPGRVPPNSALIYEVELKKIEDCNSVAH